MPGRFSLVATSDVIQEYFELNKRPDITIRYNIAPSQEVMVIRNDEENHREAVLMRWGFIPIWMKEEDLTAGWINARADSAHQKPAFRGSFKHHRCIIVATSYFEWLETSDNKKQPYVIRRPNAKPLAMAGLWSHWVGKSGRIIDSCATLTTDANETIQHLHHRMPVILANSNFNTWLDRNNENIQMLTKLVNDIPNLPLEFFPVSTRVNNARYNAPDLSGAILIRPI